VAHFKSRAFVLSSVPYRESSSLLEVLCEQEGRITLVARGRRGSSKRKGGASALDAFELVEVTYSLKPGATIGNVLTVDTVRVFPGIRTWLPAYAIASFWFEAVRALSQARVVSREPFGLTEELLAGLDRVEAVTTRVLRCFVRLLEVEGIGVEQWQRCGVCGCSSMLAHFDMGLRRPVCVNCAETGMRYYPLPEGLLQRVGPSFGSTADTGEERVGMQDACTFLALVNELLRLDLERPIRSFDFLMSVLSRPTGHSSSAGG
jgi:DNA repair protein RecO